ncbi:MAG: hypothetical protein PHN75_15425 [Syntrophales bacterium]|nr:hypothetical protein [Syntrophales bacterium]
MASLAGLPGKVRKDGGFCRILRRIEQQVMKWKQRRELDRR